MNVWGLSVRNLLRNPRRTAGTALSLAVGFSAIALFAGYTTTVYESLKVQAIYGELLGHLTIARQAYFEPSRQDPNRFLLIKEEVEKTSAVVKSEFPGSTVGVRLGFSGLLSNGKASSIFVAESLVPEVMRTLRGPRSRASGGLDEKSPQGVTVARGLAQILDLQDGSEASVLVSTVNGQANASDARVVDTFSTGNVATNDKSMFTPLALAQALMDAEGRADRVTVLLPDGVDVDEAKRRVSNALSARGEQLKVESWKDLSVFYAQVKALFDRVFAFLLSIVLVIVSMSVANAMGMSVIERTREIGTLRAIGLRRSGVVRIFIAEAVVLVIAGCLLGVLLTGVVTYCVNQTGIAYRPPSATEEVPLLIGFDPFRAASGAAALACIGALASLFPARRAAAQPIVISLTHV
jgi:putative ABC transport system permease protein